MQRLQHNGRLPRHKFNPFKIMCVLLYGDHPFIRWDQDRVVLGNGSMARLFKVPNSRMREYLEWLEKMGYITELEFSYGKSEFRIVIPPQLSNLDIGQLRGGRSK